ncbi:hypothetical protein F5B18DRAFT_101354 [Nemania serpens]|nr:hypothetical protein F5B18DRAFT_101354 [Nemania serpens]
MDASDERDSVASIDSTAAYTPTHTTEQDISPLDELQSPRASLASAPTPGRTYMIRHLGLGKTVSVKGGHLSLEHYDPHAGCYWNCVENRGWLGFSETVSGKYLGRNEKRAFSATVNAHSLWGSFVVTGHENGGYYLRWLDGLTLLRWVGVGGDGQTLIYSASSAKAAIWEFVEV